MPASNKTMIHKLQMAINQHGGCILLDKSQFFSDEQHRPITIYKVCTRNLATGKKEKLFDTTSQIQIVLYLRDYWYLMNGKELPTGNEMWEEIKQKKHIEYGDMSWVQLEQVQ